MTTSTPSYNPIILAFRILTTPDAFRWYGTQAKATATFTKTIALRGFTAAQRLLNASKPMVITAVAEPEQAKASTDPENAKAPTIVPAVQSDRNAVEELENAIAPQEYAFTEATEPDESTTSDDWQADEANAAFATALDNAIAQASGREHDPHFHSYLADIVQEDAIAQATEPEHDYHPAMDEADDVIANNSPATEWVYSWSLEDSQSEQEPDFSNAIANDSATGATEAQDWEPDDAIASVAFSEAGTRGFSDATADDGDALGWVDEDPTERRYWAETEGLESAINQTTESDEEDDTFFTAEPEPAEDFADDADDEADELE